MDTINKVQELQLELMKLASFNDFDGEHVVKSLEENRHLWQAVIMDRESYSKEIDLIKLRDLPNGYWNVDVVYILPVKGKEDELHLLADKWGADEVEWIGSQVAQSLMGYGNRDEVNDKKLLRVWWD